MTPKGVRASAAILLLAALLLLPAQASGQGVGFFQTAPPTRTTCENITSPVTGRTWCFDTTLQGLRVYDGAKYATLVSVNTYLINVKDFGATGNGTTDDTTAINTARAYAETLTLNAQDGDGVGYGGSCVYFPRGTYLITAAITPGSGTTGTQEYCLMGDGGWDSLIVWGGGNTGNIIAQGHTGLGAVTRFVVRRLGLTNKATSGSAMTAVRATGINGIALNATGNTAGLNDVVIEEVICSYLDNCIVNTTTSAVNQLTVRKSMGRLLYNQTDPVVNPLTDALVTGHGNFIYFAAGTTPQGIYLYDNDCFAQAWCLDSQSTNTVNVTAVGNFSHATNFGFTRDGGIRINGFTGLHIAGNQFQVSNLCWDIGLTALASSNVSGGAITGNSCQGPGGTATGARFTFANGVTQSGNSFFNLSVGTQLASTVTNFTLGTNDYVSVTSKFLPNSSTTGLVVLDPQVGTQFVTGGLQLGAPTSGDKGAGTVNASSYYVHGTAIASMPLTNASGTITNAPHLVQDTVTLTGGTAGVALAGAAAFTSATTYTCVCANDSSVLACRVAQNGGNGFTLSSGVGTDTVRFICAGN